MKGLDSLIRIAKWRVDEARRNLAELDRLAEGLRDRLCALDEEVARERTVAAADPEAARSFAGYRAAAAVRRGRLKESLADLETRHAAMQEQLNDAYGELKRYEIAARDKARREALAVRRAEQAGLDEIGLRVHRAASG
ncbi:MAG: hypothetical protein HOK81_14035 [Rhodospirillaceae bacterium]|nr:hypothetical protein [Rhodospirillaceae bacterium]